MQLELNNSFEMRARLLYDNINARLRLLTAKGACMPNSIFGGHQTGQIVVVKQHVLRYILVATAAIATRNTALLRAKFRSGCDKDFVMRKLVDKNKAFLPNLYPKQIKDIIGYLFL